MILVLVFANPFFLQGCAAPGKSTATYEKPTEVSSIENEIVLDEDFGQVWDRLVSHALGISAARLFSEAKI